MLTEAVLPFDARPDQFRDPYAVARVLRTASRPALHLAEALQALGGRATQRELLDLLDTEDSAAVDDAVGWLVDHSVVRRVGPNVLEGNPGLLECFPTPLDLGPPLAVLTEVLTVDMLRRVLRELGRPLPKSKADLLAAFTAVVRDPDAVRATVADAPAEIQSWLRQEAEGGSWEETAGWSTYDQAAYRLRQAATGWAAARGLLIGRQWGYGYYMPAEVALALRGPQYRAPFTPHPPSIPTHLVAADALARGSAAAASAFAAAAIAILDRISQLGVPTLRAGGIGARELAKLGKATSASDRELRLVLELSAAVGLLEVSYDHVAVSKRFAGWRSAEPAARYRDLVLAWRGFDAVPTETRSGGKLLAALSQPGRCAGCADGRMALLGSLAALPRHCGAELADVAAATLWARPLVCSMTEDDDVPFAATWREAEILGVISQGALSPVGQLLLDNDGNALCALAEELLPATVDQILFGTDLTAVVAGAPSARVTTLLDSCAERESRGAATVWRLSPASIRRALDDGADAGQLSHELAAVAQADLPQPVHYLINDVARRHGTVVVAAAVSCLRSSDTALLAEIAADRSLKRLGLTLLAPTVLASREPVEETLTVLRRAGYMPMPDRGIS